MIEPASDSEPDSHPGRHILNPFSGESVSIDEGLALLISRVWVRGVRTTGSCQDDGVSYPFERGRAYIMFPTSVDVERFLEIAAGPRSESLESIYNRIILFGSNIEIENDWMRRRRFVVQGLARDLSVDDEWSSEEGDYVLGQSARTEVQLTFEVRFPVEDIPELEKRFESLAE